MVPAEPRSRATRALVLLALLLTSGAAASGPVAARPSDCADYAADVRVCRGLEGGGRGAYADAVVAFAYAGSTARGGYQAGAGSLAGVAAREDPGALVVAAYASALLAFETVGARWTYGDGKGGGTIGESSRVEVFAVHAGSLGGPAATVTWRSRDADQDRTPEENVVEARAPLLGADVGTFRTFVRASANGATVVMLAP